MWKRLCGSLHFLLFGTGKINMGEHLKKVTYIRSLIFYFPFTDHNQLYLQSSFIDLIFECYKYT